MFPNDANGAALRTRTNAASPHEGLGNVVHKTKNLLSVFMISQFLVEQFLPLTY
jgi:hypothetical protein